ncbi:hypothetical protein [Cognatishimia sp.]|uniref:hypothetical protein n=1 Tax=Cognatishimia sp. TaxID=2211648 RepID=UPI0035187651|nr:hypothetical protein [Cognatishimia sp.]
MLKKNILALAAWLATYPLLVSAQATGQCHDGYRWSSSFQGGKRVATYNACNASGDFISIRCGPGWPVLIIERPFPELELGKTTFDWMYVDGQEYEMAIKTEYSEMLGAPFAILPLDHLSFGAIIRGNSMNLNVGDSSFTAHLKGSGKALELIVGCPIGG